MTYKSIFMKGLSPIPQQPLTTSNAVVIPDQDEMAEVVTETTIRGRVPPPSEEFAPEEEDESSSFKLEMIAWSENAKSRFAVVNGRIVRIGTSIDGASVEEIGKAHVALRSDQQHWKLRLKPE